MEPTDLVDFVAERAKENPNVRKTVEEAKLYDGLQDHAGWRRLAERVRAERERFQLSLAQRLMSGKVVSQREIDYRMGYYDGARWIIEHPAQAAASLEKAAKDAWTLVELGLAEQAESASPYIDPAPNESPGGIDA